MIYTSQGSQKLKCASLSAVVLAVVALTWPAAALAQASKLHNKQPAAKPSSPPTGPLPAIEIKVESFRTQLVAGSGVGVMADITNTSRAAVYLRNIDVDLVLPPEVEQSVGAVWSTWAFFPTEPGGSEQQPSLICLRPKETYRVFWNRQISEERAGTLRKTFSALGFIGFSPGEYPITVELKYWDKKDFDDDAYHTAVQTEIVSFAAPEFVILLGAALGGLIFSLLSMLRTERNTPDTARRGFLKGVRDYSRGIAALFGSVLLGVIITILLSRISETQFFIKVSVSDFWGAIAIGFFANYGGWTLLDKMVPPTGKGSDMVRAPAARVTTVPSPAPKVAGGQAGPSPAAGESGTTPTVNTTDRTGPAG